MDETCGVPGCRCLEGAQGLMAGKHRQTLPPAGTVKGKPQIEADPKDPPYDKPRTFGKGWK